MLPPNSDVHPMRILFLIPQDPPPKLINQKGWSPAFHEFLAAALQKDPKLRPDARAMLGYKFVTKCKTSAIIKDLVRQKEDAKAGEGDESEKPNQDETDYDYMDVDLEEGEGGDARLGEESDQDTDEGAQSDQPKYRLLVVRPGREGELRAESEDEEEESSGEGVSKKGGPSRKASSRSLRKKKGGSLRAGSPRSTDPPSGPAPQPPSVAKIPSANKLAPPAKAPPAAAAASSAADEDDGENPNFSTVVEKPTLTIEGDDAEEDAFQTVVSRELPPNEPDGEDGFSTTVVRPTKEQMNAAPASAKRSSPPRRVSPDKGAASSSNARRSKRLGAGSGGGTGKTSEFGSKLKSIYREELVTKLPFLTLDALEPLSLVSTEKRLNNFRYAMSEVASTQPAAAMLEGAQINAIVGNLLKTHLARTKESKSVPMSPEEQKDHDSMVCDISDVLKVLLL